MTQSSEVAHFFVDEAGDLTLFDARGRIVVGTEGVSHSFMLGVAEIPNPEETGRRLNELRADLLADPYFRNVPSMQPVERKTANAFHAKDDLPEVRRDVFRSLRGVECKVFVGIRRKTPLAREFRELYRRTRVKQGGDVVYSDLVTRIFEQRLHLAPANRIIFARRGKSTRNLALQSAIRSAKNLFEKKWKKGIDRPTSVSSSVPSETPCLQVADYFLWALQRLVERREDRYFALLADRYSLVVDRDDTRHNGYGEYYTSKNPLSLEKLMPVLYARLEAEPQTHGMKPAFA